MSVPTKTAADDKKLLDVDPLVLLSDTKIKNTISLLYEGENAGKYKGVLKLPNSFLSEIIKAHTKCQLYYVTNSELKVEAKEEKKDSYQLIKSIFTIYPDPTIKLLMFYDGVECYNWWTGYCNMIELLFKQIICDLELNKEIQVIREDSAKNSSARKKLILDDGVLRCFSEHQESLVE